MVGFRVGIFLRDRAEEGKAEFRIASLVDEVAVLIGRTCLVNSGVRIRFGDQWRAGNFMGLELLGDD